MNDISNHTYDIIIVGGGLAGLTSAIHLSMHGMEVLVIEKQQYPWHKVCGEYVSKEVLPYLESLGFDPFSVGAKDITRLRMSTESSHAIEAQLPLGGFGISRFCMDDKLAKIAQHNGAVFKFETVTDVRFGGETFTVTTQNSRAYTAQFVIGAFGKRSNLDFKLGRSFMKQSSPYLAVKAHYKGDFPADEVHLHNFQGGYCGLSVVETNAVNVCYITDYNSFKKHKDIAEFQDKVLSKNRFLRSALREMEMLFDKPLTISQISFDKKLPVENHILMCGDSAGLIHPLAGNGMGMAIRAAHMVSSSILMYGSNGNRDDVEKAYTRLWTEEFQSRLATGRAISKLFRMRYASDLMVGVARMCPPILPAIIRRTHGTTMKI